MASRVHCPQKQLLSLHLFLCCCSERVLWSSAVWWLIAERSQEQWCSDLFKDRWSETEELQLFVWPTNHQEINELRESLWAEWIVTAATGELLHFYLLVQVCFYSNSFISCVTQIHALWIRLAPEKHTSMSPYETALNSLDFYLDLHRITRTHKYYSIKHVRSRSMNYSLRNPTKMLKKNKSNTGWPRRHTQAH